MIDTVLFQYDLKLHGLLHFIEHFYFLFPIRLIQLDQHVLTYENIKMHLKF